MAAYNIRSTIRSVKNAVLQYSDIEVKVREATNNDRWGVSTTALAEVARATNDYEEYPKLFAMTWKRLNDHEHVMHVQKALILIDYLLRNGAERFISDAKRRTKDIQQLTKYKHYDPNTQRDDAGEARTKAKLVYELLTNDAKLTEERAKAQAIRDLNLGGMSNDGDVTDGRAEYEKNYDAVPPKKSASAAANGFDERTDDDWSKEAPPPPPQSISGGKKDGEKKKKKKKKAENGDATGPSPPTPPQSAVPAPSDIGATSPTNFGGSFDFDAVANGADPFTSNTAASKPAPAAAPASAALATSAPGDKDKSKRKKKGTSAASSTASSATATPYAAPQSGDFDLTNFAGAGSTESAHNVDIDMLTGAHVPVGGSLVDAFSQSSLLDEPNERAAADEDDGFEEEPALLDTKPHRDNEAAAVPAGEKADTKSDAWDLASDLANLDNITADPNKKKAASKKENEVSMSMMRGMQIGGASAPSRPAPPPAQNAFFPAVGAAPMMQPNMMMQQQPMMQPNMMQQNMFAGGIPNFGMQMGMGMQQQPQQPQQQQNAFGGDLPFAAQPGSQARKSNKPILFDSVPQARPDMMGASGSVGGSSGPKGPNWNR